MLYAVNGDNTVHESLEMLIECASWRRDTFTSEREFLSPRIDAHVGNARTSGCGFNLRRPRLEWPDI